MQVPRTLRIFNESVMDSILTALRMANQGPNAPSPSTAHAGADPLQGDAMIQVITASLRKLLAGPAVLKQMGEQFLEPDHLVQVIAYL